MFTRFPSLTPTATTAQSPHDVSPPHARHAKSLTLGSAKKLQPLLFQPSEQQQQLTEERPFRFLFSSSWALEKGRLVKRSSIALSSEIIV